MKTKLLSAIVIVILIVSLFCSYMLTKPMDIPASQSSKVYKQLVGSVTRRADGQQKLCSPYAQVCFTYPSTWTKSIKIHGSNFYGETNIGGIEFTTPAGTIVSFTKAGTTTNTVCKSGSVCSLSVHAQTLLSSGMIVITATFESANTSADSDRYTPFTALVSPRTLLDHGLTIREGSDLKTVAVESFNPILHIPGGRSVMLLASPGNALTKQAAESWLAGSEAAHIMAAFQTATHLDSE